MGHIDHPDALVAQPAQDIDQHRDVRFGQRRSRLVEHEHIGIQGEGARDGNDRLGRGGKAPDGCVDRNFPAHAPECLGCPFVQTPPIDHAALAGIARHNRNVLSVHEAPGPGG